MATKPLIKEHRVVVTKQRQAGEAVFGKHERTEDTAEAFIEEVADGISLCAHGHAMRTIQEVGGACSECGRILCTSCVNVRCDIDGRILCRDHAAMFGSVAICTSHSLLAMLRYAFFERSQ